MNPYHDKKLKKPDDSNRNKNTHKEFNTIATLVNKGRIV